MRHKKKHILSIMLATTAITLTGNSSVFAVNAIETAKQLQEASFEAYDRAFKLNPNAFDADLSFNYGMYLKKHHKDERAIEVFNHAIEKRPDFADALHQKGNSLRELKKFKESVYELEKAKELKPEDAKIYNSLGRSLASTGKLEEALEEFTKATELDEDYGEAYLNKGYCLEVLGRYEEAAEILKRNTQGTQTESNTQDAGVQVSSNMSVVSVQTDSPAIAATEVATQTSSQVKQTGISTSTDDLYELETILSRQRIEDWDMDSSETNSWDSESEASMASSSISEAEVEQSEQSTQTDDDISLGVNQKEGKALEQDQDFLFKEALRQMDAKLKEHKQEDVTEVLEERSKAVATLASTSSGIEKHVLNSIAQRFNLNSMAVGASGDEEEEVALIEPRTGFFISPFLSRTHAKEFGSTSGFSGRSKGYSVGFDSKIHDSLLFGFSFTKADSHMRFKQNHLGDAAKIDSNFYSLYGQYMPWHQQYFLSTIAIYGKSDIRSKALRGSSGVSLGRHKAISNILEVMAGSSQRFLQAFSVTPQLGLKYSKTKDAAYKEKSTLGAPSLVIGRTKSRDLEAIAGLKLDYRHVLRSDITLIPEIYGFASKRLNSRLISMIAAKKSYSVLYEQ